ncbi:TIGR03790 family protein [Massilia sp. YMA4]|uniref:TIGR03790 family protein n=1 Tax=Massilia sp. YMA4 TaxID=1593482 RepID=UPI0026DA0AD6|nr:TIGR03790 family protein [Massilia sp. YMA4]
MRILPSALALLLAASGVQAQGAMPGLQPAQLALVINDDEPNSVEIGELYRVARGIPERNVVHVRIPNRPRKLDSEQFARLKQEIDAKLGPDVEAVLMVWTAPYAVECNGITAAYTLGFDPDQCAKPCGPGHQSAFFNAGPGVRPSERQLRLSMLLPTESVDQARALIERGKAAGFRTPAAGAYFLVTSEAARNSRAQFFPPSGAVPQRKLTIHTLREDAIEGKRDVMFYQTGKARVDKLDTLRFLPGALADHLTSFGGDLLGEGQMSSLRWLEAGATASYGTVSEPCNFWQKFPNPNLLLRHYLNGASAIETYWRSVAWPAQGVFIGDPLAAPYRR